MIECITALEYESGIVAIDSGQVRPQMAACYLLESDSALAVIETGTNASTDRILKVISARGRRVEDVSHVIVTHVHLDHAGGAGSLMRQLPNARLAVHPYGARHMIDPSRLEAGTRAVYGDEEFDAMYGVLEPIPEVRVSVMNDGDSLQVGGRRLTFMDSPGHARHHFTIWDEESRGWFTGDTFGISYRELDTENGPFIFPTTTPVQFDPPELLRSIDRMLEKDPEHMYLTHFGRVSDVGRLARDMRAAIAQFVQFAELYGEDHERTEKIGSAMMEWLCDGARKHGVALDGAQLREVFAGDVRLNTQGIEVWLERQKGR